jgi:protein-S-isoprenylcysteine O-methyltransferase Ste14
VNSSPTTDQTPLSCVRVYAILALANLIGGGSLLLLMVFLYGYSVSIVDLGLSSGAALGWDALLCLAFCIQHSGMIRRSFRRRLAGVVDEHFHPALFGVASGLFLLALMLLWQPSPPLLVSLQGSERWLVRVLFFAAIAGAWWGTRSLGGIDAFGARRLLAMLRSRSAHPMPLTIRGPYRWVRHPVYTLVLVMIWSCPELSADRLLLNVTWTAWVVVGARLEERDMVADFGDAYRAYQCSVPMLIPWRRPIAPCVVYPSCMKRSSLTNPRSKVAVEVQPRDRPTSSIR